MTREKKRVNDASIGYEEREGGRVTFAYLIGCTIGSRTRNC